MNDTSMDEDLELDLSDLDDEYQHATCSFVYPMGSLKPGDLFKTICGRTAMKRTNDPSLKKCPECLEAFENFAASIDDPCPVCGDPKNVHW